MIWRRAQGADAFNEVIVTGNKISSAITVGAAVAATDVISVYPSQADVARASADVPDGSFTSF